MGRKVLFAIFAVLLLCAAAGANEVDDANVAAFNKVTQDVGWPTGLGREAKLVKFTADWTPPADPGKSGGEFYWVVLGGRTSLTFRGEEYYENYTANFISLYHQNRGKTVKAGSEKIVALVHRDIGVKPYLVWVFRPWLELNGTSRNWFNAKISGRNYIKPKWAIGSAVLTSPENVRDFVAAGPGDAGRYAVKIDGNKVHVEAMRNSWLCFHRKSSEWLVKKFKVKQLYLSNVKVNGMFPKDADFKPEGKPFDLEITPVPEHMPQGW